MSMDAFMERMVKTNILHQILTESECEYLDNPEFARLLRDQIAVEKPNEHDVAHPETVAYLRSLVVPIIEANPGVVAYQKQKKKEIRRHQRNEIQQLTEELKEAQKQGSIHWHIQTDEGNNVEVHQDDEDDTIFVAIYNDAGRREDAVFLSVEAACEYVIMNI